MIRIMVLSKLYEKEDAELLKNNEDDAAELISLQQNMQRVLLKKVQDEDLKNDDEYSV